MSRVMDDSTTLNKILYVRESKKTERWKLRLMLENMLVMSDTITIYFRIPRIGATEFKLFCSHNFNFIYNRYISDILRQRLSPNTTKALEILLNPLESSRVFAGFS